MEEQAKPMEQDVDAKLRASRRLLAELDVLLERGRAIVERRIRVAVLKDPPAPKKRAAFAAQEEET